MPVYDVTKAAKANKIAATIIGVFSRAQYVLAIFFAFLFKSTAKTKKSKANSTTTLK